MSAAYVKEVRNEYWAYNFWNTQTNQLVLQRRWESRLGSNLCYRNENVRSSKQLLALPARHLLHQRMLGKFPPHASLQFLQKRLSEILHKTSVTPYFVIWWPHWNWRRLSTEPILPTITFNECETCIKFREETSDHFFKKRCCANIKDRA